MLRHLAASWLFAGFLVVVAVATWRVLDARSVTEPPPIAAAAPSLAEAPLAEAPPAEAPPAEAALADFPPPTACGAAHDPFDAARAAPAEPELDGLTTFQLGTQPFADLYLDGQAMGSTPFYGPRALTLTVGAHDVELQDKADGSWHRFRLTLGAAQDNKAILHLDGSPPRLTGEVQLARVSASRDDDRREARAQWLFMAGVDALRERNRAEGCALLERIADEAAPASRWREKAENLRSRRCD